MTKWIFRRKIDGYMIVYDEKIPKNKKHAEELMKNKDFELLSVVNAQDSQPKAFKNVPIIEDNLECPLCGKIVKDDEELLEHKKEHIKGRVKKEKIENGNL